MHCPTVCNKDPPVVPLQCHNKTFDIDEAMNRRTDPTIDSGKKNNTPKAKD